MRQLVRAFWHPMSRYLGLDPSRPLVLAHRPCFFSVAVAALAFPVGSHAGSQMATNSASTRLDFRITIPAIIRVTPLTQPARIVIEDHHVAQGYVDLESGTVVKLTVNTRNGYQLSASYDPTLLSRVELKVSSRSLNISSGYGSTQIVGGPITDEILPISYRLHLTPGVRAGDYRWPVALAFSLIVA